MAKCQICGEDIRTVKSENGYTTEGICKKTGLKHLISIGELVDSNSPWVHD